MFRGGARRVRLNELESSMSSKDKNIFFQSVENKIEIYKIRVKYCFKKFLTCEYYCREIYYVNTIMEKSLQTSTIILLAN